MQRQHGALQPPPISTSSLHPSHNPNQQSQHLTPGLLSPHPLSAISMSSPLSPLGQLPPQTPLVSYNPNWFPAATPISPGPGSVVFHHIHQPVPQQAQPAPALSDSPSAAAPPPPYSPRPDENSQPALPASAPVEPAPDSRAMSYPVPNRHPNSSRPYISSPVPFSPDESLNSRVVANPGSNGPAPPSSQGPPAHFTEPNANVYFPPPPGKAGRSASSARLGHDGSRSAFKIGSVTIRNPITRSGNSQSPAASSPQDRREQSQPPQHIHQPAPLNAPRATTILITPSSPFPQDPYLRRSASAGPASHHLVSPSQYSRNASPSYSAWPPPAAAPLVPPPPPGPPPDRSPSRPGSSNTNDSGMTATKQSYAAPPTRRPTDAATRAAARPRTPPRAEASRDASTSPQKLRSPPLSINTNVAPLTVKPQLEKEVQVPESVGSTPSSNSLRRTGHIRELSRRASRDAGVTSNRNSLAYPGPASASSTSSFDQNPTRRHKGSSSVSYASTDATSFMSPAGDDRKPVVTENAEMNSFGRGAIERHTAFVEREAAAATDRERVELFAEFIVAESRIRRSRYSAAIDSMGLELMELTRDLFRPQESRKRQASPTLSQDSEWTKDSPAEKQKGRATQPALNRPKVVIPLRLGQSSETSSGDSAGSAAPAREGLLAEKYQPTLSPIAASMISGSRDEMDSRGRQTVRWWESSQDGGSRNGGGVRGIERSKRESKYMGVNREEMEQWQYQESDQEAPREQYASYGPNEYPAEKQGWHEESDSALPTPQGPVTPRRLGLDVSRLITLPPPYPRHYPAVNNNHPALTETRDRARTLGAPSVLKDRIRAFDTELLQKRSAAKKMSAAGKTQHLDEIRRKVELGEMSYASAAREEAKFDAEEEQRQRGQPQADFNDYQVKVIGDLHKTLTDRLAEASRLYDTLRREINSDAKAATPDRPQEEGDERPELLEKLTLLKWLFDVRESLHGQVHALLTDRNARYKDVILAQYSGAQNAAKRQETDLFFANDARTNQLKYEQQSLSRFEAFLAVVDKNVTHGMEMNLSAFWDIAPGLNEICDQIPASTKTLRSIDFKVQIPENELRENDSYEQYPLQYLHSVLEHASKSSYQFIESQINLLCLLHEVKSGFTAASTRVLEVEAAKGGQREELKKEMEDTRRLEEQKLTRELQERVKMVEDQWREALGVKLGRIEGQVKRALVEQGGWDEDRDV